MRNTFPEYNQLTQAQIQHLWENAIFILDTNVILNLYRYSDESSKEFIDTIEKLKDRIWIPFQVGLEFNKNRLSVISDQKKLYEEFEKKINEIISEVENKNRNPFLSQDLFQKLVSIKSDIKVEVDSKIGFYDRSLNVDDLLNSINTIFEGKVGENFKQEELKQLFSEGENRYKEQIPPGYWDSKKPENKKFGDLVIWKQIIKKAKDDKKDIIFIIDDRKDDWWLEHQGKTISARPELLREFRSETSKECHFYKPFQFLEYSNKYLGNKVDKDVILEVKNHIPESVSTSNYILLSIIIEGDSACLNTLILDMKSAGYDLTSESNLTTNHHKIFISLPNIPDLERRLNAKYIANLDRYNLTLINIIKS